MRMRPAFRPPGSNGPPKVSAQAGPAPLAETQEALANFAGRHRGETIVVCGCGPSLNDLPVRPTCITIGVNDVGRRFDPDYLVVVNPPAQFPPERRRTIEESRARAVFTQYSDWRLEHARRVPVTFGAYGGVDFSNPNVLHYTRNSPYVALCLAVHLGATRIGLIGVDFTDNHFFGATGAHPLAGSLGQIDAEYSRLRDACIGRGVDVVNLSPVSRLTGFPRTDLAKFLRAERTAQRPTNALRIVSYATTPVAGVPAILARCIAARTPHTARCVWATNDYGNGVRFDGDIEWITSPEQAEAALANADLVIVHNGKVDDRHRAIIAAKPVITMAHNYIWNVDETFVRSGQPGVVVGQYQATLPEFAGWTAVPNPVPLWEAAYTPEPKGDRVTIAYTPSGRHEAYPEGHRLYWHGKGYETTMRVLDRLAARRPIDVVAVRERLLSHAEALAAKRRAHIVIDECVTGSYHRNSLEGLACGAVVVNGVGIRPGIRDMLKTCADGAESPFEFARVDTMEADLDRLIALGASELAARGAAGRRWVERHWNFAQQWDRHWQPVIAKAQARPEPSRVVLPATTRESPVTVVIPHGGHDRLDLLAATLAAIARDKDVGQIIVAEMDISPDARGVVEHFGAHHVFVPVDGAFNKARAVNVATALAGGDLLLWLDNDVLTPEGFLGRAVAELRQRNLDCLIPWVSVHYLSTQDSLAVIAGTRRADACQPVNVLHSREGGCGGAVLLRRKLVQDFGGMSERFRGWGGEDNAWFHKDSSGRPRSRHHARRPASVSSVSSAVRRLRVGSADRRQSALSSQSCATA